MGTYFLYITECWGPKEEGYSDLLELILYLSLLLAALLCLHLSYRLAFTCESAYWKVFRLFLTIIILQVGNSLLFRHVYLGYNYLDWAAPFGLLYGPIIYLGIRPRGKHGWNLKMLYHFVPFGLAFFFYLLLLLSFDYRLTYSKQHHGVLYLLTGASLFTYIFLVLKASYLVFGRLTSTVGTLLMLLALVLFVQGIDKLFLLFKEDGFVISNIWYVGLLLALLYIYDYLLRVVRASTQLGNREELQEKIEEEQPEAVVEVSKEAWHPYREPVTVYMESQPYLDPDFDIQKMSDDLDIPKYILNKLFANHYKESFTKRITALRLDYACQQLLRKDFDMNIDELGTTCGFRSRASFYRNFSQAIGCTPLEYRDQQNQNT